MFKLKRIILSIACLISLSISAAENNNKSCGSSAWATTRALARKAGKVGWYTGKGMVIGGCVGMAAGLYDGLSICANRKLVVSDFFKHTYVFFSPFDYERKNIYFEYEPKNVYEDNLITIILGGIQGSANGVIIGGAAGFAYGMRHSN